MGSFVIKLSGDNERWYKLADQVENADYENISLDDAIIYDPNNTEGGQWFKIEAFNERAGFLPMLDIDFNVADLESVSSEQFNSHMIEFIAYYQDHRFFIQKFTKGSFVKKKWFAWDGDAAKYFEADGLIYINPLPNCIYDNVSHCIYFMDIAKAYSLFGELRLDYRAATEEETSHLLQSDIIHTDGFSAVDVGVSNRKRITSIIAKFNQYNQEQKNTLRQYIKEKVGGNLPYDEQTEKFIVKSDGQLRLLLYGIQQRFYQPPLEEEVQVATATTGLSNLL